VQRVDQREPRFTLWYNQAMLLYKQVPEALRKNRPHVWTAIDAYVQRLTSEFPDDVVSIILYGSQARGESQPESDIDLLIVVRRLTPSLRGELTDLAWQVQFEYDVVFSDIVRTVDEFQQMQREQFPYYRNIEREGLILWQTPSRLMPAYG